MDLLSSIQEQDELIILLCMVKGFCSVLSVCQDCSYVLLTFPLFHFIVRNLIIEVKLKLKKKITICMCWLLFLHWSENQGFYWQSNFDITFFKSNCTNLGYCPITLRYVWNLFLQFWGKTTVGYFFVYLTLPIYNHDRYESMAL